MPVQLRERDFQEIGFGQEQRSVVAPVGTTMDDLEKPEFWAAVSRYLKPWARYNIRAADGSFYLEMIVVSVEANRPVLRKLCGFVDEEMVELKDGRDVIDGVRVEFVDEATGWRVIRESDQYVIKDKLRERREARRQRTIYLDGIRKAA